MWPRLPADTDRYPACINGRSGFLMHSKGEISFDLTDRHVRNIYLILNPDKLRHLTPGG